MTLVSRLVASFQSEHRWWQGGPQCEHPPFFFPLNAPHPHIGFSEKRISVRTPYMFNSHRRQHGSWLERLPFRPVPFAFFFPLFTAGRVKEVDRRRRDGDGDGTGEVLDAAACHRWERQDQTAPLASQHEGDDGGTGRRSFEHERQWGFILLTDSDIEHTTPPVIQTCWPRREQVVTHFVFRAKFCRELLSVWVTDSFYSHMWNVDLPGYDESCLPSYFLESR